MYSHTHDAVRAFPVFFHFKFELHLITL